VNLKQLEYFLAVVEHGSILKASHAIYVSQPSVSVQVKSLEDELGVHLFERRHDGVVLTAEGEELVAHARGVLHAIETAKASMQNYHAMPAGTVVVGIPGSLAPVLTAPLVERVWELCHAVQLRVVGGLSGHTRQWILDGRMDFGLVYDETAEKGVDLQPLFREELYLAGAPDAWTRLGIAARDVVPWDTAARLPYVLTGKGYALRTTVETAVAALGVKLDVRAEIDATAQIGEIVARGLCHTILSVVALRGEVNRDKLSTRRIEGAPLARTIALAHAGGRPLSRAARAVSDIFRDLIREKIDEPDWRPAIVESYL
jgi:LysR family nitrogen assimilation transcriptional regulator